MCGIAGILNFDKEKKVKKHHLKKMTDIISYRGPDSEGFYINRSIGLGHRRLSIIDLDTGQQPFYSPDKNLVLIFNGEIYNYIEIRDTLIKKGYNFRSKSDTEVILMSYIEWGYQCLNKFNGMWAFALWDNNKNRLFISRDRIGEKPLFYTIYEKTFYFASEIKCFFELGIPKIKRTELLELYLTLGYIPSPDTYFNNIFKLEPAYYLVVNNGNITKNKYWDLPQIDESNMFRNKEYVNSTFKSLFRDSIRLRMRSDVPFGAFLSGGLDSSTIVSIMSEYSNLPINTFTVGFENKKFDERILARQLAKLYKTKHKEICIKPENLLSMLEKMKSYFTEPFGDGAALPTYYISKFASQYVKMVMTGDGGDELLSGYPIYQGEKFYKYFNLLPYFCKYSISITSTILAKLLKGEPRYSINRISNVINAAFLDFTDRLVEKISYFNKRDLDELISDKNIYPIQDFLNTFFKNCPFKNNLYKLMYFHFKSVLPDQMLVKVDRVAMANSIETRIPFLDYRLVELMSKVDMNLKMKGFQGKSILRNTFGINLPKSFLRAKKKGFATPFREWFNLEHYKQNLNNLKNKNYGMNNSKLNEMFVRNTNLEEDLGDFIWCIFMLDI